MYQETFANAFIKFCNFCSTGSIKLNYSKKLVVDCANGVGYETMKSMKGALGK